MSNVVKFSKKITKNEVKTYMKSSHSAMESNKKPKRKSTGEAAIYSE
jgi:hypothetical protein